MKETQITYKCPTCWTEYTLDAKYQKQVDEQLKLGYCKFCRRKNPNVPTTAEMDKLFTVEDMRNRFQMMLTCLKCGAWNQMKIHTTVPCKECGSEDYDGESIRSLRSYNENPPKRKKIKVKEKRGS